MAMSRQVALRRRLTQSVSEGAAPAVASEDFLAQAKAMLPDSVRQWLADHTAAEAKLGDTLYWVGMYLNTLKRFADAEKFLISAEEAYAAGKYTAGQALCRVELAWQHYNSLDAHSDKPFAEAEAFLSTAPQTTSKWFAEAKGRLAHYRGLAAYRQKAYANGVERFKAALAICPPASLEEARICDSLAVHYERMGDFHLAQQALKRSIQIKKRLGVLWEEAVTAQIMGRLLLIQENFKPARHYLQRSLALSFQLNDRRRVESLYNTLIKQSVFCKHLARASALIAEVDTLHDHLNAGQSLIDFQPVALTKPATTIDSPDFDSDYLQTRLKTSKEYVVTQFFRARVAFLKGDIAAAESLLRQVVIPWLAKHQARKDLGKAYRLLACITAKRGDYQTTVEMMGEALSLFRQLNLVDEQAKTHYELGQAFAELGDRPLAMESLLEALRIAEQNGLRFMIHHIQEDIHRLDSTQWERIINHRARHEPVFERERTLLDALTQLSANTTQTFYDQATSPLDDGPPIALQASQTQSLVALLKVGQAISGEPNVDRLLELIMAETQTALNCDRCTVFIHDPARNELWSRVATGVESSGEAGSASDAKIIRFPSHLGLAGYVCKTGETLNIKNPYDDPRFNREIDKKTGYTTENLLCMPMKNRDGEIIGIFQVLNKKDGPFSRADEDLLMAIASQASVSLENAQRAKDQKAAFVSFIKTLSTTIDARDPITAGHSDRVAQYSSIIGDELKLLKDEQEALNVAALLHDIGKIGVREDILTKQGRLTLEEYRHIQKHAEFTYDILKNIHFERHLQFVPEIAASHHERMDGTGYFRGLAGEDIPFLGRILALSDVFDAITSRRHYRDRMPFDRVLTILQRDSGSHFDPRIVSAFFNIPLYKLGNLLLVEQRLISPTLDDTFLAKLPDTLNVTIAEYHELLKKKNRTKGERLICADFDAIYQQGDLDHVLD